MARCGCTDNCSCVLVAGDNVAIIGNGSSTNPYVISAVVIGVDVQDENGTVATDVTTVDFQGSGVVATAGGAGEAIVSVRGYTTRAVNTTQVLLSTDEVVLASTAITLTLPAPASFIGRRLAIKNVTATTLTIAAGSGTIDGSISKTLTVQYSSVDLVTDGTNWWEI